MQLFLFVGIEHVLGSLQQLTLNKLSYTLLTLAAYF